jgi:hypothetical protein
MPCNRVLLPSYIDESASSPCYAGRHPVSEGGCHLQWQHVAGVQCQGGVHLPHSGGWVQSHWERSSGVQCTGQGQAGGRGGVCRQVRGEALSAALLVILLLCQIPTGSRIAATHWLGGHISCSTCTSCLAYPVHRVVCPPPRSGNKRSGFRAKGPESQLIVGRLSKAQGGENMGFWADDGAQLVAGEGCVAESNHLAGFGCQSPDTRMQLGPGCKALLNQQQGFNCEKGATLLGGDACGASQNKGSGFRVCGSESWLQVGKGCTSEANGNHGFFAFEGEPDAVCICLPGDE